jgi:hypothetical protein
MKSLKFILLFVLLGFSNYISAQMLTQTIRGTITDEDGKFPLIGANIIIVGSNPVKGSTTNVNGEFRFDNIPVGRVDLVVRYMGYEEKTLPNVLVSTGKEVVLTIELKESIVKIDEVVVKATKNKGEVQNEMSLISSRSFSIDETKRYAGAFQDPSRMVSAYAGVTSDPNGDNDIIVRGNSPKGILWRMEGIEIPNPNHFANEGATGGPINALNSELLSNSDFYTGAFSPEFGDVLSGVFDLKMRPGNNEKREYSIGIGVLGTDIMAEGPINKLRGSSYLANYRYSSLDLLDKAGLVNFDGVPRYQDAAFKVVLPTRHMGNISVFGLGGMSSISGNETDNNNRVVEKFKYNAQLGTLGVNDMLPFSQNTYLKLSLAASNNGSKYYGDDVDPDGNVQFNGKGKWEKSSIRSSAMFSTRINTKNRLILGVKYTKHFYNLYEYSFDDDLKRWVTGIDMKENSTSVQSYASWKYRMNDNLTFVGGVHSVWFQLNKDITFEPRAALRWQIAPKHAFNVGFGVHSKIESIITYFTHVALPNGGEIMPNRELGLSKARHYVLGYEYRISTNLNSKVELYYQDLYNIPVENVDTSNFSLLNNDEGYVSESLVNKGTGKNYGIDYTLEHFFSKGFYFLVTTSLYQSKYKALEGIQRNTKYNGNYTLNFLIGKEFKVGKKKSINANTISVNTKLFANGGRRYIPVDLEKSKAAGDTKYDYSKAFDKTLDKIYQVNLSVSYRINRPKASHEFVLDISNITAAQGRTWEYYNKYTGKLDYERQLNLLPNFMYRVHF